MDHPSLNYDYVLERALSLSANPMPDVLDFGCGTGKLLEIATDKGFAGTLWGADSFVGYYQNWADSVPERQRGRIRRIEDNRIPFDDESFDVVVSNQVFEHVFQPQLILPEIERVLRPVVRSSLCFLPLTAGSKDILASISCIGCTAGREHNMPIADSPER